MFVNLGMWLERFISLITSLSRSYIPSAWGNYTPSIWEIAIFIGSIGLFLFLMCLFVRFIPLMSLTELKTSLIGDKSGGNPHR
jgi:Ni/Fe-hydrogenase subunit HybB-like protein